MKELKGAASAEVRASTERCLALLADLEGYARWYPGVVRAVDVLEREGAGASTAARVRLRVPGVPVGELGMTLELTRAEPGAITLTRVPHGSDDSEQFSVRWRVAPHGAGSRIAVSLDACLSVPRLVPVRGIGDASARGFVGAAARALDR